MPPTLLEKTPEHLGDDPWVSQTFSGGLSYIRWGPQNFQEGLQVEGSGGAGTLVAGK